MSVLCASHRGCSVTISKDGLFTEHDSFLELINDSYFDLEKDLIEHLLVSLDLREVRVISVHRLQDLVTVHIYQSLGDLELEFITDSIERHSE